MGPLADLMERLTRRRTVGSVCLVRDERGQRIELQPMRRCFWVARKLAGADWRIRDLRAKAASDVETSRQAPALLGHRHSNMTDGSIRKRTGAKVDPVMRDVKK